MRWVDFRLRYIDPGPREIAWSDKFPKRSLPLETRRALGAFVDRVWDGHDLNPYQGRGLSLRHDVSGARKQNRTDMLWAEWGIHHFHLSPDPIPEGQYFSRPADYLAFCLVFGNVVAVVDVLPHPDLEGFSNPDLMRTIAASWPEILEPFRLRGVKADRTDQTQQGIHARRAAGFTTGFVLDEKVYMGLGRGITSAGTSLHVGQATDELRDIVDALAKEVADENGGYRSPEIDALEDAVDFCLGVTPLGLAVIEQLTNQGFLLPSRTKLDESDGRVVLTDLLLPSWALKSLQDCNEKERG